MPLFHNSEAGDAKSGNNVTTSHISGSKDTSAALKLSTCHGICYGRELFCKFGTLLPDFRSNAMMMARLGNLYLETPLVVAIQKTRAHSPFVATCKINRDDDLYGRRSEGARQKKSYNLTRDINLVGANLFVRMSCWSSVLCLVRSTPWGTHLFFQVFFYDQTSVSAGICEISARKVSIFRTLLRQMFFHYKTKHHLAYAKHSCKKISSSETEGKKENEIQKKECKRYKMSSEGKVGC